MSGGCHISRSGEAVAFPGGREGESRRASREIIRSWAAATGDLGIGQVWEDFVTVADVVLPMVYPSHYYKGSYGLAWPNGEPYRVVRNALSEALERSRPLARAATIRPFLQAFTLGRRKPRYTPHEIREQIRAAEELGINTWVLWNPRSVYQRDSLRPYRVQLATVTDGPQ